MPALKRPLFIGMNNPLSLDARFALYPYPPGCAGARLCKMMGLEDAEYLSLFDRVNLIRGEWKKATANRVAIGEIAAANGQILDPKKLEERTVILLGQQVQHCYSFSEPNFKWKRWLAGGKWVALPHPSGRCRTWNLPEVRDVARQFFVDLVAEARLAQDPADAMRKYGAAND